MRLILLVLLITSITGSLLFPTPAHAASSGPMPRSDYPTPAKVQVINPADNDAWNCGIAIDCASGEPFVHSAFGEDLGRVTGWAVVSSSHQRKLQFVTTSNVFQSGENASGVQWNQAALNDELATMPTWHVAHPVTLALPTLPDGARTLTFRISPTKKNPGVLFVSAAWGESAEVELLALYSKRYAKQAQRLMLIQLRDAIAAAPADPVPTPTSVGP